MESHNRGPAQVKLLLGRLSCVVGIVLAPYGAYFISLATEAVALCLGILGFGLGSRRLGLVAVALAVAAAFFGLLWGQGYIPNLLKDDGGNGIWGIFDGG